jgi:hypothetical protein
VSLNYLATRFRCSWPWDILVMLCDGRIVCGCADPYAKRVLGDARTHSIEQIWTGPFITKLRGEMTSGGSEFCGDCPLKLPLAEGEAPPQRSLDAGRLPGRMFIECLQHLLQPGVLRARDGHHQDAPGRHARLRSVQEGDR